MPYLFTPPQRQQKNILAGRALQWSLYVSSTVYKTATGWVSVENPSSDDLSAAVRILSVSGRPQVVDDATAAELIAAGIGTCSQIDPAL